jgi:hypothetical protein
VPFAGVVADADVVETPGLADGAAVGLLVGEDAAAGAGELDALGTSVAEAATEGRAEDAVVVLAAAFPQPASARTASAGTMIFLAWPA